MVDQGKSLKACRIKAKRSKWNWYNNQILKGLLGSTVNVLQIQTDLRPPLSKLLLFKNRGVHKVTFHKTEL
jgi:hypothetical protein